MNNAEPAGADCPSDRGRQARALRMGVVGVILLSATAFAASPVPSSLADRVSLPLFRCPTTGYPPKTPLLAALPARVPPRLSSRLSFYGNGALTLLAPRGWKCRAGVGEDGTSDMIVYPPGESRAHPIMAVHGSAQPACASCIVDAVCPLFPKVARTYGFPCTRKRPPEETVYWPMPEVAAFRDPPGVKGDGDPSGGQYPANGVVIFVYRRAKGGAAAEETCTLPESQPLVCTVVLRDFIRRDYPRV